MGRMILFLTLFSAMAAASGGDLVLFEKGRLHGALKSAAAVRDGKLVFRTSDATKLILAPPAPDLSRYDRLDMTFTASRGGDSYRFTMTSNPPGSTVWNYYFAPVNTIGAQGKQTVSVDLAGMHASRKPVGRDRIQTLEFNFVGWNMPYKKGLVLEIEKIVLSEAVRPETAAKTPAAPAASAKELVLFENGKLNGVLKCAAKIKDGRLVFRNSDAVKLKIAPPSPDLARFDRFEMVFSANRGGDGYRFTMTSNPEGSASWNYYAAPQGVIPSAGKQTLIIELDRVSVSRKPAGRDKIDTLEFNFTGWDMPYKKGLVLEIEKMRLFSTGRPDAAAADRAAMEKALAGAGKQALLLPSAPWIPVPDVSDRKFWNAKSKTVFFRNLEKHARRALEAQAAPPPVDHYLDFLRNGNRSRYEKAYRPLIRHYENLTMALCVTADRDKYLGKWREFNKVLCGMATWVLPAHDSKLDNLLMRRPHIELVGSQVGAVMSTAAVLLKPYLSKAELDMMDKAVKRQIVTPLVETALGKRSKDWFLVSTNNWNAVCTANVMQILLAVELPENTRRNAFAFLLAHAGNYLKGFNSDGYCSEGISYWSYGFGHYLRLASVVRSASAGRIDLMRFPMARLAADFPEKFMLSRKDFFPAFADCGFTAGLGDAVLFMRDRLLGRCPGSDERIATGMLPQLAVWCLPPDGKEGTGPDGLERISAFRETGVFVFRHPDEDGFVFACKGGSNHELHNHNDVGSYSLAFPRSRTVLGDLGGSVYTRDSFNANRYRNPLLNSFGHPVPVVGGALQDAGPGTDSRILSFESRKDSARVVFDIRPAYRGTPGIRKLERSFQFDFSGRGKVTIADAAELAEPRTFETALTTFGKIVREGDHLQAEYEGRRIAIAVETFGVPWNLSFQVINAETRWKDTPRRYAVVLNGMHKNPRITMTFEPSENQKGTGI